MLEPARYLPISPRPYRMRAGLARFGDELGNGARDAQFFQIDRLYEHYLRGKRALDAAGRPRYQRHGWLADTPARRAAHTAVLAWMDATLAREHGERLPLARAGEDYLSPYDARLRNLQEDAAVVQRPEPGRDELIMAHVCFPSGWPSDRVLGRSFRAIHGPVPAFADTAAASASMINAMVERGPYLRFVWSLCADDALDHHPELGEQRPWDEAEGELYVRVERQVSVPFAAHQASLFLIRTYLYAVSALPPQTREDLAAAIACMPEEVAAYKGVAGHRARIAALLARARPA
ncbi:heme-dependent oxidative N-demethylase subunit alpha family protein [Haliangium ochraceum]|uniref:DUF3445 domain-containing protein n=1 Tax=Haliangium ochraceum (strain DSM 14365 / JCM 11303 / SMP-2) TaxID=502025 RepID=D0LHT7_HALO1|nr:heme-dependent oxidative N-demethylase subunit alpha family protein [Haliangium ochraceum]ACY14766.1 hypothetical protein Hoch_2221 [Haliangium ochraceum DSM 14365]